MISPINVVLVEDDKMVREALRLLIQRIPDTNVIGEAGDGRDALALLEHLKPKVLLVDIILPSLNGIEVVARVRHQHRDVEALIVTGFRNPDYLRRAFAAGAKGFILKSSEPHELEIAIRAVARGLRYVTPEISQASSGKEEETLTGTAYDPAAKLTSRQREILQLIAEGQSNKEIAQTLDLSFKTIVNHRTDLMRRLGVHKTATLIRAAIQMGIIVS